jgi:hypothetical protein
MSGLWRPQRWRCCSPAPSDLDQLDRDTPNSIKVERIGSHIVGFTGCLIGLDYFATIRIAIPRARGRHRLDV